MKKTFIYAMLFALVFSSCEKDDDSREEKLWLKVNTSITAYMYNLYLWTEQVSWKDPNGTTNPIDYFNQLRYKETWSYITDDAEGFKQQLAGAAESFGYDFSFGYFKGTTDIFAVVNYVFPFSPAAQAGLKRGSIVLKVDGEGLSEENLGKLYKSGTHQLLLGELNGETISPGSTISLSSRVFNQNPVLVNKVITKGSHKIGYLCYTDFIQNYNTELKAVFSKFKQEGITDMVLDLRYNPGGDDSASTFMANSLVPQSAAGKVFYRSVYNKYLQEEYERDPEYHHMLETRFDPEDVNLDLSRIYILTTDASASASELVLIGLMPYMEVIQVGTQTHGKYTSMAVIDGLKAVENTGNSIELVDDADLKNWLMLPVVSKYANAEGLTDFSDGISPGIGIGDDPLSEYPLGNENEPMLAKTISLITGDMQAVQAVQQTRSSGISGFRHIPNPHKPQHLVILPDRK